MDEISVCTAFGIDKLKPNWIGLLKVHGHRGCCSPGLFSKAMQPYVEDPMDPTRPSHSLTSHFKQGAPHGWIYEISETLSVVVILTSSVRGPIIS